MNLVKRFSILGSVAISSLVIAQSASASFVVFVSGNDPATLQRVRSVSPSAFATKINNLPVVQAGIFNSEASADSLASSLQQSGLPAQKYFRASGGKETNVQVPFTETNTSSVVGLSNPQQVVIQPSANTQPANFQAYSQPQAFSSAPQQTTAYSNPQYQQITTNTVVPQVQTQMVLVPRMQQVLVPETRQVVTQTVVPQTQIVQTGFVQPNVYSQPANSCIQPTNSCIQPASYMQPSSYTQPSSYVQPQTSFIPDNSATSFPTTFDNSFGSPTNFSAQPQPNNTASFNNGSQLAQINQNPNFRFVAAVPASVNNQILLSRVRQYSPNAFFASSWRGTYIFVGAYENRDAAEAVSRYLRSQGIDSRVLYF
ncbi:MAG: hypothetical protein DCF20_11430 [Pseudanabaena sp.]|nr:MAG: hypothetical protein DCF20_11430 [Pseudanabaena sp.]